MTFVVRHCQTMAATLDKELPTVKTHLHAAVTVHCERVEAHPAWLAWWSDHSPSRRDQLLAVGRG